MIIKLLFLETTQQCPQIAFDLWQETGLLYSTVTESSSVGSGAGNMSEKQKQRNFSELPVACLIVSCKGARKLKIVQMSLYNFTIYSAKEVGDEIVGDCMENKK